MSWFSKIFSSVGAEVISSVGSVVDDLVTSDEERALSENQKKQIEANYRIKIKELMAQMDRQAADHEARMESELTERLKLDMKSDSWLSKNIRPMTLIFMTLVVTVLAFSTLFSSHFTEMQNETIKEWIPFFQTIMLTIYGFYFGSRGLEKLQKIRSSQPSEPRKGKSVLSFDQEPRG